jgi:uncharacterized protein (TIGR02145 family)
MKKFSVLSSWRTALGNLLPSAHGHQGGSRKAAIGSMLIMAMLFAACGDDDSSFAPRDNTVSDSDIVAESFDDLPVCSSKREGATAYIKDEKNAYMCVDGDWTLNDDATSSSSVTADETKQSSSSEALQSSSSEVRAISSSSENISAGSIYDATAKTLKDLRDDKTYKTVTIGTQTWMAENLNYETGNSYCYGDDASYCSKYGRLYTWAAAMDSSGTWSTNGKGCGYGSECSPTGTIRGICPEGWHLPDTTEWNTLFTAVGGSFTAGTALKSTSGWNEDEGESGNGTDSFGFSALPAGYRYNGGDYDNEGYDAYFWSSTEYNSNYAYYMLLYYNYDYAALYDGNKNYGFSVRCLKD